MTPGLGASQWADGHQGRVQVAKDRTKLLLTKPVVMRLPSPPLVLSEPRTDAAGNDINESVGIHGSKLSALAPSFEVSSRTSLNAIRQPVPNNDQDQVMDSDLTTQSTDFDDGSESSYNPVAEYVSGLVITSRDPTEFRMLEISPKDRIYGIKFLEGLKTDRMHPRPFMHIPPGKLFQLRKGFKIASLAKKKGKTLAEAVEAERLGKLKVPDSPKADEEARRPITPDTSPIKIVTIELPEPHSTVADNHSGYRAPAPSGPKRVDEPKPNPMEAKRVDEPAPTPTKVDRHDDRPSNSTKANRRFIEPPSPLLLGRLTPYSDLSPTREPLVTLEGKPMETKITGASKAEEDRKELLRILEQHVNTRSTSVHNDTNKSPKLPAGVDGVPDELPVPLSSDVSIHEQASKPSDNTTLTSTIALIDSLAKPSDGNQSLQEALNLIKLSLLKQSVENTTCAEVAPEVTYTMPVKSYSDEEPLITGEPEVDHSIATESSHLAPKKAFQDVSKNKTKEYSEEVLATISDVESDYSVEFIVDAHPLTVQQSSVPTQAGQTLRFPELPKTSRSAQKETKEKFVLKDWQIEPNVQYDGILPESEQPHCHLCTSGKLYKSKNRLITHYEKRHFYCEKCDMVFLKREELLHHVVTVRQVHNYCQECNLDFHSLGGYLRHTSKIHPSPVDPINCPGCRKRCETAVEVVQHLEQGLCSNISKDQFGKARVITALIQRHRLGPIQSCTPDEQHDIKEQSYKLLRGDKTVVEGLPLVIQSGWSPYFETQRHEIRSYNGTTYKCPYSDCDKSFNTKNDFIDHLRAGHFEHGVCPGCFKQFKFASALLQHLIQGHRNCRFPRGSTFPHAIGAVSGGYVKAEPVGLSGKWAFVAGAAPRAELYIDLPQVAGTLDKICEQHE